MNPPITKKGKCMTTITPPTDVALPVGADPEFMANSDWELDGQRLYRCVWSPAFEPRMDVRVVVTQFEDGSIGTDGDDAPLVYICSEDVSPDAARAIAASIIRAADLADQWAAR